MKRRFAIAALAAVALTGLGALAGTASARDCGARCGRDGYLAVQNERLRPPGPAGERYGGPGADRTRSLPGRSAREPLSDRQIWSIALGRVPGRILRARLHGNAYYFKIVSRRGNIADVVVDRYSGRVISVSGGP
jgi:uncharacterized membrane protein YkoI